MKAFLLPLALLLLFSCSKKKAGPEPTSGTCPNYEAGMVIVQVYDTIGIEEAFSSVYKYGIAKVPPGAEKYWVSVLRQEPVVSKASLACLYEL